VVERPLPLPVPQVVTSDARAATGWFAAAAHGHPADRLRMVGVTGTNGKTTTTQLVGAVLRHAGQTVEVIGTLSGPKTTPEATDLQRSFAALRDGGTDSVVMEVSSHALALHRIDGTSFEVAVFTNLGRDHLDLHGTVERYFAAKARLFEPGLARHAVVNVDDVHGRLLADSLAIPVTTFSTTDVTDVRVTATSHAYRWRDVEIVVGIGGAFNVMNSLAAATACSVLGIPSDRIAAGLAAAPAVPGRMEPVDAGQPFALLVDYAHTPDGLREALRAVRAAVGEGRVIAVFGCGGDRDREKRPEMGAVVAELADVAVVTSDNPRSEDPLAIIDATVAGVPEHYRDRVVIEPDRRRAIAAAIRNARHGDVVLVAGKGHETTQTIGDTVVPFDDRAVARQLLEELA
jgi:UDP-N-acetylmuramoyl-L-alanyl-D-glutamate--2,6-diaminopimelate ligase